MPLTVKELKELIKDLPDDTPVVKKDGNFELNGSVTDMSIHDIQIEKRFTQDQTFRDAFDHTTYTKKVYVYDEEIGTDVLRLK